MARRIATYQDVLNAPPTAIAEVIGGELSVQPRPSSLHTSVATALGEELGPPFKRGRGGPGGWMLLDEPELHLGADVVVPDLAGWRRERMPELPDVAYLSLAPDWVAEVLSPSTFRIDRIRKPPIYARERVAHVWLIDPSAQTLEVLRLDASTYRIVLTAAGDERVRAEPFDAIELELGVWWAR